MIGNLDRGIVHLRDLLGKGGEISAFAQNFMAKIGQADSPDAVIRYKRILESIKEAGVLDHEDAIVLFGYCDQRLDLVYDKDAPSIKSPAPVREPSRMLKESICENQKKVWFLDGNNILCGHLFGTFAPDGKPTELAWYKLSEALISLVSNADKCQICLYFNGPIYSEYSPANNVKVIYSGGTGNHRADDVICAGMEEYLCGKESSVPFFITIDNRDLHLRASQLCTFPLYVENFLPSFCEITGIFANKTAAEDSKRPRFRGPRINKTHFETQDYVIITHVVRDYAAGR